MRFKRKRERKENIRVNNKSQVSGLDNEISGDVINGHRYAEQDQMRKDEFHFVKVSLRCIFSRHFSPASDSNHSNQLE